MYTGWRGRTLGSLISTVFVAIVGILSGKAEKLSGMTKFCREIKAFMAKQQAIEKKLADLQTLLASHPDEELRRPLYRELGIGRYVFIFCRPFKSPNDQFTTRCNYQ